MGDKANNGLQVIPVWKEKKIVTVLIFILIVNAILLPVSILIDPQNLLVILVAFLSASNLLVIFGLFVQQVYLSKIRYPSTWIVGVLILWFMVLPMMLALLQMTPDKFAPFLLIWSLIGYPFLHFQNISSLLFSSLGIFCQWLLMGFLWWRWQKTLDKLPKDTHPI